MDSREVRRLEKKVRAIETTLEKFLSVDSGGMMSAYVLARDLLQALKSAEEEHVCHERAVGYPKYQQ